MKYKKKVSAESIHFVTGKLAEPAVRECVGKLAEELGFSYSIEVLPITVAALMTPKWLLRHVRIPEATTRMIVPGYLVEGLNDIQAAGIALQLSHHGGGGKRRGQVRLGAVIAAHQETLHAAAGDAALS